MSSGHARVESDLNILDRVKWARKESRVIDIQGRLRSNKASLNLMLTILQCKSMEEAESAVTRLCDLVEQVLAKNQEMSLRLRNLDGTVSDPALSIAPDGDPDASTTSSRPVPSPPIPGKNLPEGIQRNALGFAFEEELLASRVYRKPLFSDSGESLVTSAARTTASSILSALSLTDVSNISILAVPVYAHEISNSARYSFRDFQPETRAVQDQQPATKLAQIALKANKWNSFASAVLHQRKNKASRHHASQEQERRILGVPLKESIEYANVSISLMNEKGEVYFYGYVPLFVGKIGAFLKEKARAVETLFCISESPLRLQEIEAAFDKSSRYGKGFDWTGYTVHDAASILLRFLLRFPESVIPVNYYEDFQNTLKTSREDHKYTVRTFRKLIILLPPLSQHLFLYLLDLLAVFASNSEINKMDIPRIAAVFQPAILSPIKAGDDFIEEATSRQLSQDVLIFLIENQDEFLVGLKLSA